MSEIPLSLNLVLNYNTNHHSPNSYSKNLIFNRLNEVRFIELKHVETDKFQEHLVAQTIVEWMHYLKNSGCQRLSLVHKPDNTQAPDYMMTGLLGGGGTWYIEAKYDQYSHFWQADWARKQNMNSNELKVWNVTYFQTISKAPHFQHPVYDLAKQRESVRNILTEMADFAVSHRNTNGWEVVFRDALHSLDNANNPPDLRNELDPDALIPLPYFQLLEVTARAFVFGTMGSWNDVGQFSNSEANQIYIELSRKLYNSLIANTMFAINGW